MTPIYKQSTCRHMPKGGTFFSYTKLNVCLCWQLLQSKHSEWARFAKSTRCLRDRMNWNACNSTCSYIQFLILPLFDMNQANDQCTFYVRRSHRFDNELQSAAIITHKRFLTCNISHTKRISDSQEKQDASHKKWETSPEKQDWCRKKQDEKW